MYNSVKSKYPDLKCEKSIVKNRVGAQFEQVNCLFEYDKGYLILKKYVSNIAESWLELASKEQIEKDHKERLREEKDI
ncbi:hypothetical protein [Methylomicrobium sp. Wu6]|uniref:hypothetical protein n=1 Tax=Methylomicrobium sp. Wu6 TaxID=3107928 RepID=UPI002DD6933D|nr:hypothetical protein [Methylomicrobium sp. Wu6]MEC4747727.1 hypothetical protein [Methylomicrobium sp. Wu6]